MTRNDQWEKNWSKSNYLCWAGRVKFQGNFFFFFLKRERLENMLRLTFKIPYIYICMYRRRLNSHVRANASEQVWTSGKRIEKKEQQWGHGGENKRAGRERGGRGGAFISHGLFCSVNEQVRPSFVMGREQSVRNFCNFTRRLPGAFIFLKNLKLPLSSLSPPLCSCVHVCAGISAFFLLFQLRTNERTNEWTNEKDLECATKAR